MTACSLCHRPGAKLWTGQDLGHVHPACFRRWDRAAEAYERSAPVLPPFDQVDVAPARRALSRAA